uniref:Uncharacterized protein n=1 Tax=Moschus moschiferus TaxID=68415 RepID=A0A8C6DUK3_MOSMO
MAGLSLMPSWITQLPGRQLWHLLPHGFWAWGPGKGTVKVLLGRLCPRPEEAWRASGCTGCCLVSRPLGTEIPPPPGLRYPRPEKMHPRDLLM